MIESYFFVPANSPKYINNICNIKADNFVLDLEDSIKSDDLFTSIFNLKKIKFSKKYLIRVPSLSFLKSTDFIELVEKGFKRFMIPKVASVKELKILKKIYEDYSDIKYVLLVENTMFLLDLKKTLKKYNNQIEGIALGSHDYSASLNMIHSESNLKYARDFIFTIGKAYNCLVIDIASMQLNDENQFKEEILKSFKSGYSAKFFIHPRQLKTLNEIEFFSESEISKAYKVVSIIGDNLDFKPTVIDGLIIEKPHLNNFKRIIKWHERKKRA